jgi:hypothetical protein
VLGIIHFPSFSSEAIDSFSLALSLSLSLSLSLTSVLLLVLSRARQELIAIMLSALSRRVARHAGGEAVALFNAAAPSTTASAAEIGFSAASSSSSLLLRSCFSSSAPASTSGASSSFTAAAATSCAGAERSGSWLRRYSAAFFADLTPPSAAPSAPPNPVGAASHLKAALKPRQGRNRFARAWRRASETQADARRRKHETSVALAVRDAKRRRRWAAAGAVARGADGEIL